MDEISVLEEIGLRDGEIKIYLTLLKLGPSTAHEITSSTKMHRTTAYDFLEKLENKGLVSSHLEKRRRVYSAASPDHLKNYLKEKEEKLNQLLPQLKKLHQPKEDINIEVYRGKDALKNEMMDALQSDSDHFGIGIDEEYWEKHAHFTQQIYIKKMKQKGKKERMITKENPKYLFPSKHVSYRFIPEEEFSPITIIGYEGNVDLIIWDPEITVVKIKSKNFSKNMKTHFEYLWRNAMEDKEKEKEIKKKSKPRFYA